MDNETWNLAQLLIWIIGIQTTFLSSILWIVWSSLSGRIDKVEDTLSRRIDLLDDKVTDIDRRICRLEGAFASKDCCMIKDHRSIEQAQ